MSEFKWKKGVQCVSELIEKMSQVSEASKCFLKSS